MSRKHVRPYRFEVYPIPVTRLSAPLERKHDWYRRMRAPNGRIIWDGGQGYSKRYTCVDGILALHEAMNRHNFNIVVQNPRTGEWEPWEQAKP